MTIEGVVEAVMETFPLQLRIDVEGVAYRVSLTERTSVSSHGTSVDPGRIKPSARVRITGSSTPGGTKALTADSIEILAS